MKILTLSNPIGLPVFAQIQNVSQFKAAMGSVLGILMTIAFVVGVVMIIAGAMGRDSNPEGAKKAIVTGSIIAASVAIMTILFVIFGHAGAAVQANYN